MELHLPLHLGVVAIEKGAFRSPSTKVANFTTYLYIYSHMLIGCWQGRVDELSLLYIEADMLCKINWEDPIKSLQLKK